MSDRPPPQIFFQVMGISITGSSVGRIISTQRLPRFVRGTKREASSNA